MRCGLLRGAKGECNDGEAMGVVTKAKSGEVPVSVRVSLLAAG